MAAPVQPINPPAQNVPVSLLPPPADEEPVDEELREVFIEEAGEVLETIGRYLPAWKADHDDREALTEYAVPSIPSRVADGWSVPW